MSDSASGSGRSLTKTCLDCGETKLLDDFSPSPKGIAGRNSYCKFCMRERSKASYRKRRAAVGRVVREARVVAVGERWCPDCETSKPLSEFPRNRSSSTGYGDYCKPCHNTRGRENRIKNHGSTRNYHLKGRYGITADDYDRMRAAQRGLCAGCWKAPAAHVDHDHATGKVRGLLCFNCNQALGNARDDIAVLRGLVNYLHASRGVLHSIPVEVYQPLGIRFEYVPTVRHSRPS